MGNINRESQADRLVKELNKRKSAISSATLARALEMPLPSVSKRVYDLRYEGFNVRSFPKFDEKRSRWLASYYMRYCETDT